MYILKIRDNIGSQNCLCKYSIQQFNPHCLKTQFSGNSRSELTNINGKFFINIPEGVILKLGEINMNPLIVLHKTQSFITGLNFSYAYLQVYDKYLYPHNPPT